MPKILWEPLDIPDPEKYEDYDPSLSVEEQETAFYHPERKELRLRFAKEGKLGKHLPTVIAHEITHFRRGHVGDYESEDKRQVVMNELEAIYSAEQLSPNPDFSKDQLTAIWSYARQAGISDTDFRNMRDLAKESVGYTGRDPKLKMGIFREV